MQKNEVTRKNDTLELYANQNKTQKRTLAMNLHPIRPLDFVFFFQDLYLRFY